MKPVNVGLLGLGTVGGGTFNVLSRNAEEITRRAGRGIRITHAAAREYDAGSLPGIGDISVTDDAFSVVDNPDIDIVIELIGGYEPARELVLKAIANGKHVVTANKALIAMHGNEIFAAAQEQGVMVAFEAAVNEKAAKMARDAGLEVVQDRCVKIEHGRLFGGLNWAGVNTKVISSKRPQWLPY